MRRDHRFRHRRLDRRVLTDSASAAAPHQRPSNVVEANGVGKSFSGTEVLSDIGFAVPSGTIVGFIGPSGCGKTTLVRLMTGMYAPTEGEVHVGGRRPTKLSRTQRQDIGYLPQSPVLFDNLSAWHNLSFHASLYGVGVRRRSRLRQMLDFVELTEHRRKPVRDLSGGMQRRVALAAALVHDPHLIFLDEPTAGIDPILRRKFWDRFRALRDQGRTLIITTQYVSEAAYCDLVAVLSEGRLLVLDTPEGLRRRAFGGGVIEVTTSEEQPTLVLRSLLELEGMVGSLERIDSTTFRAPVVDPTEAIPRVTAWLDERNIEVVTCREHIPDYDDVFIRLIQRHRATLEVPA